MTPSTLLADPPSNETIDVFYIKKLYAFMSAGARGVAAGCGTELQAGWSQVRSPILSLEFVIHFIFPAGSTKPLTEMSSRNTSWMVKAAGA